MIYVARDPNPPNIPIYSKISSRLNNRTQAQHELENAISFHTDSANFANGEKLTKAKFTFKVYKDRDLAKKLEEIFVNKCAYCESRYTHVSPKDIEHFRPKNEVLIGDGTCLIPGYYWLAGEWSNLFVSCIDCNRSRNHEVPGQSDQVKLGKATQFPLTIEANRLRHQDGEFDDEEQCRLLLNPCLDNPEEYLTYDDNALIIPRQDDLGVTSAKGKISIDVYALQRKELVEARLAVLHAVKLDLKDIRAWLRNHEKLTELGASPEVLKENLERIREKKLILKAKCVADAPYLGMVRDYIRKTKAAKEFDDMLQNGIDPEALLQ
jgi:uncharacterized protein (TIGR02646 family)